MKKLLIKSRLKIVYLFLFLSFYDTKAQTIDTYTPKISNIPTSPEAALFTRFGEIPVGHYTGTANISVPLYTIKEGNVEIPIELRYHSSGIKVADEATWVGLGWDLSPGGAIIQEVKGKRDQDDEFYWSGFAQSESYIYFKSKILNNGPAGIWKYMYHTCSLTDEYTFNQVIEEYPYSPVESHFKFILEKGHGQPDIYSFNFAGHSGKFFINFETQQIEQIDKKEDILFERNGFNSFTATTNDGVVFHFNVEEVAFFYTHTGEIDRAGKTYKLSSIDFPNNKTINFSYIDTSSSNISYSESKYIVEGCQGDNSNSGVTSNSIQSSIKTLTQISSNEIEINFELEDRQDIYFGSNQNTPKRLKLIDIVYKPQNKKIKTYEFNYSYFPYDQFLGLPIANTLTASQKDFLGKRLKLNSLKEIGYSDDQTPVTTKPEYKFEYNLNNTMPLKISFAKDFWGYYNGANNYSLLPDLDYFEYNYYPIYKQHHLNEEGVFSPNVIPFEYINYSGVDRYTNNQYTSTYMLNKITYPTGGSTKFEYEPNSFLNQFIPDKTKLNIARKRTILKHVGTGQSQTVYHKSFTLDKATSIIFNNTIFDGYIFGNTNPNAPTYSYNNFQGSKIVFSKTRILPSGQSVTTIIKQWEINSVLIAEFEANHGKTWNDKLRVEFDSDKTVYYSVDITNTLNYLSTDTYHVAEIKSDFYYYDDTGVNKSESNQCGVRIKSLRNYNENGILVNDKMIKYFEGKLLNRFEPLFALDKYCQFMSGQITNGEFAVNTVKTNSIFISSDNLVNNEGNLIGYGRVEEIDLDNNLNNLGKKAYRFHNNENLTLKNCPNITSEIENGTPLGELIYDKNNSLLHSKYFSYENINPQLNYFYGTQYFHTFFGGPHYCTGVSLMYDYKLISYPMALKWIKLKSTSTTTYFNGNPVTTNETLTYDSYGNVKTITKSSSKNETLVTKYYYATDYTPTFFYGALVSQHMIGIPILTEEYRNDELLSKNRIDYDVFENGLLLPSRIYASKGNDPMELKLTYNLYNNHGKPLQYTLENGIPVSILWSGEYPSAKIENATYAQASTMTSDGIPNVMVTRYTFKPLVGVTSIIDPKGNITRYNYDAFGRLINVKDKDNNILSENEYHYLPQN